MMLFWLAPLLLISAALIYVWHVRRKSIAGIRQRNRYFRKIATELGFSIEGDDYLIQLTGCWKGRPAIVYPHNFEGPGSITLIHLRTQVTCAERTWLEPSLGLGRAIVESKRGNSFSYEQSGNMPAASDLLQQIEKLRNKFPFVAITHPARFLFTQLATQTLQQTKEYVVVLALDAGRKPPPQQIREGLDAAGDLAQILEAA